MAKLKKILIQRKEIPFILIIAIFAIGITYLPYLFANIFVPDTKQFMGVILNVPDHAQYFAWMRGFAHNFLISNNLTPEPNPPVFFNLLWWGIAQLNKIIPFGYPGAIQFLRIVGGTFFIVVSYVCASAYFSDVFHRKVSLLVIVFGSGLGWIWVVEKYLLQLSDVRFPLDLYVAEGNTFLCLLGYPHFLAAALYITVFWFVLKAWQTKRLKYAVLAGLLGQFWGWQHAYDLWIIYAVMGMISLLLWVREKQFPWIMLKAGVIIVGISFPPGLYSFLLTSIDPLWKEILDQFANAGVFTPSPLHLLVLMGIPLIFAIIQSIYEFKNFSQISDFELFVLGWFVISFVLVYLPVDYQIHMLNGWQIPIGLLAVKFWIGWIDKLSQKWSWLSVKWKKIKIQKVVVWMVILLVMPTNIYLLAWRFVDLGRFDYPYFLHKDELEAFQWLDENANEDDVVLSSLTTGQYIPAWTGKTAFLAHWAQTVDYYAKENFVNQFYKSEQLNPKQISTLNQFSIDYVYWGPSEKMIASNNSDLFKMGWNPSDSRVGLFNPDLIDQLEPVYSNDLVQIYRWADE